MTRKTVINILRREIECMSHEECKDCILKNVHCFNILPTDAEYMEVFEMSIKALTKCTDSEVE